MRHFWRLIGFAANAHPIQLIDERHAKDQKDQHSKQNPSSHMSLFEIVGQKKPARNQAEPERGVSILDLAVRVKSVASDPTERIAHINRYSTPPYSSIVPLGEISAHVGWCKTMPSLQYERR
jgi:hypothetical protein